jgi:WhiB family redox-sensing transcriptional regulator
VNWREDAACQSVDPDVFFPIGAGGLTLVQVDQAKAVCRRCDVVEQCLRWALRTGQADGIWGGTTESERRAVRAREDRLARRGARDAEE